MKQTEKFFAIVILSSLPYSAFAYLDPGSGSLILQMIVGAAAGAFFIIKQYWSKIKGFFSKKK